MGTKKKKKEGLKRADEHSRYTLDPSREEIEGADPFRKSGPKLTLSKGFGIKYGSTDDWTDRFRGYGKLYVEALELTKQKLELDRERQEKSRKQKTWRELDAMPALERAKHREQYRKVDDVFDKRHSAIQAKCDGLEAKLLDEKIAEAKAERLGKSIPKDDGKPGESLGETSTEELQATLSDLAHRLKTKPGDKAILARQKAISSELKGRGTKKSMGLTLDLVKAKYTKRTGTPGNYKYEYAGTNGNGKPKGGDEPGGKAKGEPADAGGGGWKSLSPGDASQWGQRLYKMPVGSQIRTYIGKVPHTITKLDDRKWESHNPDGTTTSLWADNVVNFAMRAGPVEVKLGAKKAKAEKPKGPTVTVTGATKAAEKAVGQIGPDSGRQEVRSAMISMTAAAREKPESKGKWRDVVAGMAEKVKDPKAKKVLAQAAKLLSKSLGPATKMEEGMKKAKYVKRTGTPGNYKYEYSAPGGKKTTVPRREAAKKEAGGAIKPGSKVTYQGATGEVRSISGDTASVDFGGQASPEAILLERLQPLASESDRSQAPARGPSKQVATELARREGATVKDLTAALAAGDYSAAKLKMLLDHAGAMDTDGGKRLVDAVRSQIQERGGERMAKKSLRQPRASTHGLSPSNIREATAHADAVFRSRALRGPEDVVIGGGRASVLAKSRDGSLVTTEVADVLLRPTPLAFQQVLCKSVHSGGCDEQYSKALSACPGCGAGTVESRGMPSFSEIGVEVTSDAQGFRRPREPDDVVIKD